jgi:hypothetical protein
MECCICYTNINANEIDTLVCSHYFHTLCINNWIITQTKSNITPSCPICRCKTITDIVFDDEFSDLPPLIPVSEISNFIY